MGIGIPSGRVVGVDIVICLVAVLRNESGLRVVPDNLKTPEMCMTAVSKCGLVLEYIPDKLKSPEFCKIANRPRYWKI